MYLLKNDKEGVNKDGLLKSKTVNDMTIKHVWDRENLAAEIQLLLFGTGADISYTFSYDNNSMNSYVK